MLFGKNVNKLYIPYYKASCCIADLFPCFFLKSDSQFNKKLVHTQKDGKSQPLETFGKYKGGGNSNGKATII